MEDTFDDIIARYRRAAGAYTDRLRRVQRWDLPTPCAEWDVRALTNHMTRGNRNYVALLNGASAADFLADRDTDALGDHPLDAYVESVWACARAFSRPGALSTVLDYPLGRITGAQALAVRTTDSLVHTWDLTRALGRDDDLDADLAAWADRNLTAIYAGLAESPAATDSTHRFFAARTPGATTGPQDRLLRTMGRDPGRPVRAER